MCGCARFSRQTGSLARGLTALGWTAKGFCSLAFIFVFLLSGERKTPKKKSPCDRATMGNSPTGGIKCLRKKEKRLLKG